MKPELSDRHVKLSMLHVIRPSLANVFLLIGEQAVLIDAGGPKDVPRIFAFLREHHVDNGKLSLILLTHGHWDHAGGAAQIRAETKAPIVLHRGDVELVRHGVNGSPKPTCLMSYLIRTLINRGYPPFEPDVLIDGELDLQPYGVAARVLPTPGHSPGSISVLTEDGAAIVGDLLMGGWLGGALFGKRPGLHYFADDLEQIKTSIRNVLAKGPRIIHVAHGGPLEPADVARFVNS
jgi:glyoxylase-like metal-dependent hydrolase (beta-lactamase superfamily II)